MGRKTIGNKKRNRKKFGEYLITDNLRETGLPGNGREPAPLHTLLIC